MKRNWNKLKEVLEDIEKNRLQDRLTSLGPDDEAEYFEHLWLAVDGGLVNGVDVRVMGRSTWGYTLSVPRLTFAGHDTLDAIRSQTVWAEVQRRAGEALIPITLELIKAVVLGLAKL